MKPKPLQMQKTLFTPEKTFAMQIEIKNEFRKELQYIIEHEIMDTLEFIANLEKKNIEGHFEDELDEMNDFLDNLKMIKKQLL